MNTIATTPKIYTSKELAIKDARDLQSGELDGWKYTVVADDIPFSYLIEIRDEEGTFVGYWTEEQSNNVIEKDISIGNLFNIPSIDCDGNQVFDLLLQYDSNGVEYMGEVVSETLAYKLCQLYNENKKKL